MSKTYLGDSVYAEMSEGMVRLTTDNGLGASNTIFLEPEVMEALKRWHGALDLKAKGFTVIRCDQCTRNSTAQCKECGADMCDYHSCQCEIAVERDF